MLATTRTNCRLVARLAAMTVALALTVAPAAADPCVVTGGTGTVVLPPAGCDYLSPDEVHVIIDGLPPGTTIELAPIHKNFICGGDGSQVPCSTLIPPGECETAGGGLNGNVDCFNSTLDLQATGTGLLEGYNRLISIPVSCEVHTGPRTPGDIVQSFNTDFFSLSGQITGDPDFDLLRVTGGTANGMPSPGHTTLVMMTPNQWSIDSFFDISYEIEFVGATGSLLEGFAGTTSDTIRMMAGSTLSPVAIPAQSAPATGLFALVILLVGAAVLSRRPLGSALRTA